MGASFFGIEMFVFVVSRWPKSPFCQQNGPAEVQLESLGGEFLECEFLRGLF